MGKLRIWRPRSRTTESTTNHGNQSPDAAPPPKVSTFPAVSPEPNPATALKLVSHSQGDLASEIACPARKDGVPACDGTNVDPSAVEPPQRWHKKTTSDSNGPWSNRRAVMKALKPPPKLLILDSKAHNPVPRSPIAWFIDQLGIPILKIIPRGSGPQFTHSCEYELGDLNISKSVPLPQGYHEPFTSSIDFIDGSWRKVPIFSTPVAKHPFRRIRTCEVMINDRTERITIAFKVFYLDTDEDDQYCRTSYEESWTYYAFDRPTLQDFYEKYGDVQTRTTEEHRAAREFYIGPWKADGRQRDTKVPKMYEESKKFLKVDGDAERMHGSGM